MLSIKKLVALDNPFRLTYHKIRAIIANFSYGFPSKNMIIIGVTGTNGKTTTSNIIAKGLRAAGKKVFMFTTVNIIIGDKEYVNDTKMTSPDAFLLQRLFKQAKEEGCDIAVIETASHGIKMSRVWGLDYDIAVLTNITQDHLDLHRTMKDYVNTKLSLFKNLISYNRKPGIKKTAVINVGSEYSELFVEETYDSVYLYGKGNGASLVASNIRIENTLTKFDVKLPGKIITIETKLKGDFNIENILAAIGVFMSFSISGEKIIEIIKSISGVPGRLELIENELGADIFVDYAHTPDALEKVLTTLKDIGYKKIITVFGATGDRDKTKRPIMGEIVSKYSDIVILTQDDDYTENTESIIKDVLPGINRVEGNDFFVIPSRKEAIEVGVSSLEIGDALLVAGKGDEHIMVTNSGPIEWHDKTIIKQILKDIDDNKIIV
ncbi:UDP-N-acetylmuramoyl-L-alanyl-D-glutamate--2,6-diaminopimelate ligase [Candidatus Gracilibacteria bacterium]|nr:UDP-N-acetylmuramoyl-L-alanyl-D-glutamate--2,6-diaminopimelate ligase [Candidatus Gracilibacteria bacterium]